MAQEFREPYTISSHLARHALLATDLPLRRLPKLVAHAPVRAALVCDCAMAMESLESLQCQSCTGSPARYAWTHRSLNMRMAVESTQISRQPHSCDLSPPGSAVDLSPPGSEVAPK